MDTHPKYSEVAKVCAQHPLRARALFQVYLDLKYGQRLNVTDTPVLGDIEFPVVSVPGSNGLKPQVFVPVYADEKLDMKVIATILKRASELPEIGSDSGVSVHLAIVESDSTIAYYKIG
ncbi:tRNA-splicing endonuclease subunit Sen15, partial [Coemansia sp. RSA 1694]